MNKINFSTRLKELRIEKNITQAKLAEIFSVTDTAIRNWENRGTEPDFATLCKLADFFGVSTDYLLGREN